MQNIPDALKGEALLLWEAGQVFDLEPEDLSPFVGVSADRIYEWFGGGELPTEDEIEKILAAIDKIEAAYPEPAVRLRGSAEMSGAWWGKTPEPTESEAAFATEEKRLFNEFMQKASAEQRPLIAKGWLDFAELLALAMKLGIRLPTK